MTYQSQHVVAECNKICSGPIDGGACEWCREDRWGEGFAKECNVLECVSASSLLVSGSNVN